ncbi:hypothetical protein QFC20_002022 [Naganishia adeliensis]|uniref:Uncharacterized protein n=1 Tax=Naganishia adeliensis TaxID=92952 RepID=A0ACC2WRH0_9TREE|nr:hypothetical protein QFC20_002022 [Naganishia adeliensis]
MTATGKPHLVIIGAGVIGLTTALVALEGGKYQVTIVARDFPGDKKSVGYTSPWAGAMDMETLPRFLAMSQDTSSKWDGCFLPINQTEYFVEEKTAEEECLTEMPNSEDTNEPLVGDSQFRYLPKSDLPPDIKQGCTFDTVTIDTSIYLRCLATEVQRLGGSLVRYNLSHVTQLQAPIIPRKADVIIVCAGLGARHLGGVEDQDSYPIRDTIPRASGDVILGGFKTDNDWTAHAVASQTTDILERCIAMAPDLIPETVSRNRDPRVLVEELRKLIIEEGSGLRPARKGGVRIESETIKVGSDTVPLVHHYGHSGAGYQASFGSVRLCLEEVAKVSGQSAIRAKL